MTLLHAGEPPSSRGAVENFLTVGGSFKYPVVTLNVSPGEEHGATILKGSNSQFRKPIN